MTQSTLFDIAPSPVIMTYNLKNAGWLELWDLRRDGLISTILNQKPLVLGTQEGLRDQLEFMRENLPGYDYLGQGRDADGGGESAAIFFDTNRISVLVSGDFWLSPTPDAPGSKMPDEDLPRITTWMRTQIEGYDRPVQFINTHLTYVEERIPAQMQVLENRIAQHNDPDVETILTGDFNIGRHREAIEPLRALGFVDAWSFAEKVSGPVFTFAEWQPWSDEDASTVSEENRIDWILYRPADGASMPTDMEIATLNTHVDVGDVPAPSDHFPVILRKA